MFYACVILLFTFNVKTYSALSQQMHVWGRSTIYYVLGLFWAVNVIVALDYLNLNSTVQKQCLLAGAKRCIHPASHCSSALKHSPVSFVYKPERRSKWYGIK